MNNKRNDMYSLIIMLVAVVNFVLEAQVKESTPIVVETKNVSTSEGPKGIVRSIKQDRKGTIWITSWEGVYKYDGKSFTNVMSGVSSARFFAILEDNMGNLWFATVGSGVYYYNGKSFQHFTTKDGLADDIVGTIYEDKSGTIWFGTSNGISRYDGKSLPIGLTGYRNLKMNEAPAAVQTDSVFVGKPTISAQTDSVHVSSNQQSLPKFDWTHNDVNAIVEDKTGKFWIGTRGHAVVYDGNTFTTITNKDGKPFTNVRSIIKDKKGNMWLGGGDGLWRYDGSTFTNFTKRFVGYIFEDKKGNIWTSSESADPQVWVLSRYDGKTLNAKKPTVIEVNTKKEDYKGMVFGILEATDGSIWYGGLDGVYRYDGKTITDFNTAVDKK